MIRVAKRADLIDIFTHRNAVHGERWADHISAARPGRTLRALNQNVAKAALEEPRAERSDTDLFELRECGGIKLQHATMSLVFLRCQGDHNQFL